MPNVPGGGVRADNTIKARMGVEAAHEWRKQIGSKGGRNHPRKIDPKDHDLIRKRVKAGESQHSIAKSYGVYQMTISRIARGTGSYSYEKTKAKKWWQFWK